MTVKELIEFLKEANQDLPVILSKDGEGNGFKNVYLVQEAVFVPKKYGAVEVYNQDDEDAPNGAKPCVVLWPT
jgi:hypothetical protein